MALSNWDAMAWDSKGRPCRAELRYKQFTIAVYKNWAHLMEGGIDYYRMRIDEGSIDYYLPNTTASLAIQATRGPQEAIFLYASIRSYYKRKGSTVKQDRRLFAIGCSGYTEETLTEEARYVGILPETEQTFRDWIYKHEEDYDYEFAEKKVASNVTHIIDTNVHPNGKFLPISSNLPQLQPGLRYCQGDMFFALHGIVNSNIATPAGQAKDTVASQIIANMQ